MTGRGAANFLTRVTAGLAAAFFATSLLLSLVFSRTEPRGSILDTPAGPAGMPSQAPRTQPSAPPSGGGQVPQIDLNKIPDEPLPDDGPRVPQSK
jgi:preprotein translocase subunit SecG